MAEPLDRMSWDGAYVGGNLDFQKGVPIGKGIFSLHAGRNFQMNDTVLGTELEVTTTDAAAPVGTITWMTRAKLRAGLVQGRTMAYATVGAVRAESTTGPEYGVVAGLGVEYRIAPRWTIGGEVLHHHFDSYEGGGSFTLQSLSARVSYSF